MHQIDFNFFSASSTRRFKASRTSCCCSPLRRKRRRKNLRRRCSSGRISSSWRSCWPGPSLPLLSSRREKPAKDLYSKGGKYTCTLPSRLGLTGARAAAPEASRSPVALALMLQRRRQRESNRLSQGRRQRGPLAQSLFSSFMRVYRSGLLPDLRCPPAPAAARRSPGSCPRPRRGGSRGGG